MITFKRETDLFDKFKNRFGNSPFFNEDITLIVAFPNGEYAELFERDEVFASSANVIYYNESKADELKLTEEERFACIAHEIGHFKDKTSRDHHLQRECNADEFAVNIGLRVPMISALEKLQALNLDEDT